MFSKHNTPNFPSLRQKVSLYFGLGFSLILLAMFSILYTSISQVLSSELDQDLLGDIQQYRTLVSQQGIETLTQELRRESLDEESDNEFIRLLTTKGQIIYQSDLSKWREVTELPTSHIVKSNNSQTVSFTTVDFENKDYPTRVVTAYLTSELILQAGELMETRQEVKELVLTNSVSLLVVAIPLVLLLSYFLASKVSKSITLISSATTELGNGSLAVRVPEQTGERETHQLAVSFNRMVEKVDLLIREMREMTDNIAHDLRSPLGRIRAISEVTLTGPQEVDSYRHASENTLKECDRLLGLINTTLDVAEAEAGIIRGEYKKVDLPLMLKDICEMYEPLAEQKRIHIKTLLPDTPLILNGYLSSLQRMMVNLIDNAVKYTKEHGSVLINLDADNKGIRVSVSDTGIGIPPTQQQRVFERFFRCDHSRTQSGNGLGLSYARAVARVHGGDIILEDKPEFTTCFTVCLPV